MKINKISLKDILIGLALVVTGRFFGIVGILFIFIAFALANQIYKECKKGKSL